MWVLRYSLRSGFRHRRRPTWNVVGYTLRCQRNRVLYTGITNNPRAREAEHRLDGKRFGYLNIETRPMSRGYAEAWEARRLARYRDHVGRNPHYNRTDDGQYHAQRRPLRNPGVGSRKTPRPPQRDLRPSAGQTTSDQRRGGVADYGDGVSGVGWIVGLLLLLVGLILVVQMVSGPAG